MNEDLQPTAEKIKQAHAGDKTPVPLDQPHPEALGMPPKPPEPEKPPSSEAKQPEPPPAKEQKPEEPPQLLEPETKKNDTPPTLAGYKPEDLLTAPLKPPEPVKTESRSATLNSGVRFFLAIGVLLAIIGIILILFHMVVFGLIVAVVGALAVTAGVFVPLKE